MWLTLLLVLPTLAPPVDLTIRGKECRIKTDVKPKVAKPVAAQIDRYCANFETFYEGLGLKTRSNNKVVIRLFAEYEEYAEFYHRNHPGQDPPAAYFSPSLNGVVCYHDPDDPYLRQVLFHETSHQYIYRYAEWAPKWANEGLAEYFEGWRLDPDGSMVEKRPPFFDLLILQKALGADAASEGRTTDRAPRYLQPRELVEMQPKTFMDFRAEYAHLHGYLHYATSWGLTWYLLEGPNEADRALYLAYLQRLCKKGDRAEPFKPEDWDRFEERWKDFILAIELTPVTADDHVILAANLRQEREYQQALEHYQAALELAPDFPDLSYWMGYCFKRRGKYDEALPHLIAASESDEDDPRAPYQLARIVGRIDREKEEGEPERALEYAREASGRVDDKNAFYLSFVARCQQLCGDTKKARQTMKKVLKLVKDADEAQQARYQKMLDDL